MLDDIGRSLKDRVLNPMVALVPARVTPTAITAASLLPGIAAAALAAAGMPALGLACFALNRILDGLDGLVARSRGLQSDFGGYLDIMVDFVVYAAVPIGLWWGAGAVAPVSIVVLLAVFYVNGASWMYLSALLEKRLAAQRGTTSIAMPRGLVEGTETVALFTLFFLFPRGLPYLFGAMALATAVGVVQRLQWAARALR